MTSTSAPTAGSRAAPLRVLLLCDRLDVAGGVERCVCQLANHLAGHGFAVTVGTVDTPAAQLRYPLAPTVQLCAGVAHRRADEHRPAARTRLARAWRLLAAQWRCGRALARVVRATPADVIVLNGLVTACSALLWLWRAWPRVVCCDHNHFNARSALWRGLRQRLYPRVAALVSLTEADAPRFKALNAATRVIPNASSLWAEAPALPAGPQVLAVGRHVAQKGFDLLLLAWAQVLQQQPQARLRIVGDGPLTAVLQAQAAALGVQHSVEWAAPTPHMQAQYRSAAVFVLPSRYEGMPLALLEAQALGVPAVAFDCPTGPRDILGGDGASGLLVPAENVPVLAQALLTLLTQPDLRARMAHAAIDRSRQRFSPQRHFDGWTALLCDVGRSAVQRRTAQ